MRVRRPPNPLRPPSLTMCLFDMSKFAEFFLPPGVEPVPGEPLRYHVASRSRIGMRLLVDLQECGFNGACSCEDFEMRHLPGLKRDRTEKRPRRKRRCWHIKQALYYHAELYARMIAREFYKQQAARHD